MFTGRLFLGVECGEGRGELFWGQGVSRSVHVQELVRGIY